MERETGDPALDLVLDAGPRVFGPETPEHAIEEVAKSPALHWYKIELQRVELAERLKALAEIRQIGRENREIEYKATNGLGLPYCRLPQHAVWRGKQIYGFDWWRDEKLLESFLDAYPECRIKVTRGTRGQEYAGNVAQRIWRFTQATFRKAYT